MDILTERLTNINLDQVPLYLRDGEYFKSLSEDGGQFSVPAEALKPNTQIANIDDLRHLLHSLQYWMACANESVEAIGEFLVASSESDGTIRKLIDELETTGSLLRVVYLAVNSHSVHNSGALHPPALIQLIRERHHCSGEVVAHLAAHSNVQTQPLDNNLMAFLQTYSVESVAEEGHLKLLTYLFANRIRSASLMRSAVQGGHLNCVEYLVSNGKPLTEKLSIIAASHGHINVLQYLRAKGVKIHNNCSWHAATNGHLACLQYLYTIRCPWGVKVTAGAAKNGHFDCLKFAHQRGCSWNKSTCSNAAEGGFLDCLQYAHENGCPWDDTICSSAAKKGNLQCLEYAHKHGGPLNASVCYNSALFGNLACLRYAHENGCEWSSNTVRNALWGGHIECLKYACENDCPMHPDSTYEATVGGSVECLECVHKLGSPWHLMVCDEAAALGHLSCLQYAHENGSRWNSNTTNAATAHLSCLVYAIEHKCSYRNFIVTYAFERKHDETAFYMIENFPADTLNTAQIATYAEQHGRLDIIGACVRARIPVSAHHLLVYYLSRLNYAPWSPPAHYNVDGDESESEGYGEEDDEDE